MNYTLEEQAQHRAELVAALRSGEYRQARGQLRDLEGGYCCLGVACDISGLGEWQPGALGRPSEYVVSGGSDWAALPHVVKDYYGFTLAEVSILPGGRHTAYARTLSYANDEGGYESNGLSFEEIADLIEAGNVEVVE